MMLTLIRMKDHDVTWLYGPLQTGNIQFLQTNPTPPASQLSRSDSFTSKKPILKKRSPSEVMLQRSLSSSTLMKQATDALRAQQSEKVSPRRPVLQERRVSDFLSISGSETPLTRTTTNTDSSDLSTSSSGAQTPCTKRHIHFNNRVEQCIAINDECDDCSHERPTRYDEDSSSEDDLLIMKPVQTPTRARISRTSTPSTPRNSFSSDNKTIAMLPSTTLNYRSDTPDVGKQLLLESQRAWNTTPRPAPSPSKQTMRPAPRSANFLLDDEDDVDMNWQPSAGRRDSIFPQGGLKLEPEDQEEEEPERHGLKRTPSGMFMPYEDDDDYPRDGFFGKIMDTVNTAKDIAHVIWNVGWQR